MAKIKIIRDENGKEEFHLAYGPLRSGDRIKAKLKNGKGEWETMEGVIKTAAELGMGDSAPYSDELWLHVPDFDDMSISNLFSSGREMERI